ncbi:MAG: hypothetical protein LBU89_10940 [Fibromonadaceae bacterium]|jgi:hypothetical protein|nr:hypothetical protein [Fibromonadaceae bacterium]
MPIKQGDNGQFAISDILATNAAALLSMGGTVLKRVSTDWEPDFKNKTGTVKFGSDIKIKIPSLLQSRSDFKWDAIPISEREKTLAINKVSRIPLEVSLPDATFNINSEEARGAGKLGQTAGQTIAADCDADIISKMVVGCNNAIVAASPNLSTTDIDLATVALDDNAMPESALASDKTVMFNSMIAYQVRKSSKGLFNPQTAVANMFLSGSLPKEIAGFEPLVNRRVGMLEVGKGNFAGFSIVDGSNRATVNSTTGFRIGDRIVLKKGSDNVTVVDPYSKTPLSSPAMRSIIGIEGANILLLSQEVILKGVNQNVSDLPDAAAYPTGLVAGSTYDIALVFYREAFTFASPELDIGAESGNGVSVGRENIEGVNLVVTKQFVNTLAANTIAFQAIWGSTYVRPEWASLIYIPKG